MAKTTPRNFHPLTTEDLKAYTAREIAVLPASVLGPIIRQGIIDIVANEPNDADIKLAIDVVRHGHWVPGLPRRKSSQQDIDDLFGG